MATMIVGIPLPVLSRPRPTHTAFIRPVWSTLASRGWYMKRQITDAPTSETASGMKMNDLAIFSFFERSASTATASPIAVAANTTVTTHHRLLLIVPRTTVNTAYSVNRMPASSGAIVELPSSTALPGAPAVHRADGGGEGEDDEADPEQPAGEHVRPVAGVPAGLVLERVDVVVELDEVLAVGVEERQVQRADRRDDEGGEDEEQRRADEDHGARTLIDAGLGEGVRVRRQPEAGAEQPGRDGSGDDRFGE